MRTLRTAFTCCLVALSVPGCATCHQTQAERPEKVAWWEPVLGILIGSAEAGAYDAARCNSERQSH